MMNHRRSLTFYLSTAIVGLALSGSAFAQKTLHTVNGVGANDAMGQVVDILGDANGDGYADFMGGAWRFDAPGGKTDAGVVRVYSGFDGSILYNIYGDLAGDHMGWGSSSAFDVNGDGFADICGAADEADIAGQGNAGTVKIISGQNGALIWQASGTTGDLFGWSSGAVGDINNDGKSEIVVGAVLDDTTGKTDCGSATVLNGATGLPLFTFFGDSSGDQFGYHCYGAGDVNGDGVPDIIVGAPADDNTATNSGSARIFSGATGTVIRTFNGTAANDNLGRCVSSAGDVNLDGRVDVIVGAYLDDVTGVDSGSARVISGANFTNIQILAGDSAGDRFGTWVRGAGDTNGDGYPDVVVGAPGDQSNGSVQIFSGATGAKIVTFVGDSAGDAMGTSVGAGGDIDKDGFADVVAGAPNDDNTAGNSGSVRAMSAIPVGIVHFGSGTPGCEGVQLLNGNSVPKINNPGFGFIGNNTPPSSLNLLIAADGQIPAGADQLSIGATMYIDFFASTFLYGYDFVSDANGSAGAPVPIPNDVSLVGVVATCQFISVWPVNCGLGPNQISSSIAAVLTIQP